jgi:hypothetical protein
MTVMWSSIRMDDSQQIAERMIPTEKRVSCARRSVPELSPRSGGVEGRVVRRMNDDKFIKDIAMLWSSPFCSQYFVMLYTIPYGHSDGASNPPIHDFLHISPH